MPSWLKNLFAGFDKALAGPVGQQFDAQVASKGYVTPALAGIVYFSNASDPFDWGDWGETGTIQCATPEIAAETAVRLNRRRSAVENMN